MEHNVRTADGGTEARKEVLSERSNLFEPNDLISIKLSLQGDVSPEQVKKAVQRTYESNEVTLSKLVITPEGRAFYERVEKSGCEVSICNKDWMQLISENECLPFCLDRGEFIRCFVIPKKESCEVLFMAHHLSGDGKAMVYFIDEFLQILSGKEVSFQPQILISKEMLAKQKKLKWVIHEYIKACNKSWSEISNRLVANKTFSFQDYRRLYGVYWSKNKSTILTHSFSLSETEHIKEQAKNLKVTVNSFLVTAFAKSFTGKCTIGIPVTVREDENRSMANYTGGIEICHVYHKIKRRLLKTGTSKEVPVVDKEEFRRNARKIQRKINKRRPYRWKALEFVSEIQPVLFDAMLLSRHGVIEKNAFLESFARATNYAEDKTRNLGVTNLMRLSLKTDYEYFRLCDFVFIPPAVSYSKNVIGVSTLNGKMTITCHAMNGEKKTIELFEKGVQILQNMG